jgi:hypothetical protein
MSDHIHSPFDGRGRRRVFVNGNEVERAIWADLKRGLVCYAPTPMRIKRNSDELYTRTLRGQVTVEPISD